VAKAKTRRDSTGKAEYSRSIKQLAKVLARWIEEDRGCRSLDEHLTQVAEDLEALVAEELKR
jgi:hypothetical protein